MPSKPDDFPDALSDSEMFAFTIFGMFSAIVCPVYGVKLDELVPGPINILEVGIPVRCTTKCDVFALAVCRGSSMGWVLF